MDDQPDIPDDYADLVDAMVDTNSGRVLPKSPSVPSGERREEGPVVPPVPLRRRTQKGPPLAEGPL
jgi:hypothetical protein